MNCSGGSCAPFFAPTKGLDNMNNKEFLSKTDEEKRLYLSSMLKHTAGGILDDNMIGRILPNVEIHRQYTISVYSDQLAFRKAVSNFQSGKLLMSLTNQFNGHWPVAVVITPHESCDGVKRNPEINIFTSNPHYRKGEKHV
jgi:hypothetical protein